MRKTGDLLEDTIAAQGLGGFDPTRGEDQRVEQSFDRFAGRLIVVALRKADPPLELAAQAQLTQERVPQSDTTEGREALSSAGNTQISGSPGHRRQTALSVRFHEASAESQNIAASGGKTSELAS
jgi:hypothetical protein